VEEALYILAQSYDKLGLEQLRDAADRVLKKNYPESRFLSDGLRRRDDPWWKFW
jgi:outer membrane protein assembly factor BamD